MSETNSACGGGAAGLSDSYATALWVVDYMLTGAEHGVDGMNFHGSLGMSCTGYTPLCQVGTNEYAAQPIYYGMLLTHKPLTGKGLRLIIENLSQYHSATTIKVAGHAGRATVLPMTGPSLLATSGVQIQGASVGATGTITPRRAEHHHLHEVGLFADAQPLLGGADHPHLTGGGLPSVLPRRSALH